MGDSAKKRGTNIGEDDGMYSLVIAEDEKMMRESLVKLVDWASLGFTMEAAFSDGAQLIDYLRTHIPDVVLTDIQMIRVDGMEVARFIHEHNLPTCVILLTGHKNFEYARSAIEYRVKRYLLKPITVPQLKAVFRETCAALDDQEYIERVMQKRDRHYSDLISYEMQNLIVGCCYGLVDEAEFHKRYRLIHPAAEREPACVYVRLRFCDGDGFIESYGLQATEDGLTQILRDRFGRVEFYPVAWNARGSEGVLEMTGVFLLRQPDALPVGTLPEEIAACFAEKTPFETTATRIEALESLIALSEAFRGELIAGRSSARLANARRDAGDYRREQERLLYHCLLQGDERGLKAIAARMSDAALFADLGQATFECVQVLMRVIGRLTSGSIQEWNRFMRLTGLQEPVDIADEAALKTWFAERLSIISDNLASLRGDQSTKIADVIAYIHAHYAEDITLSDAADGVYLNAAYLSRLFKKETGRTFSDYLTEVRIDAATRLIESSNLFIYEIAQQSGYRNLKYFYKVFKKVKGYSPNEQRRKT